MWNMWASNLIRDLALRCTMRKWPIARMAVNSREGGGCQEDGGGGTMGGLSVRRLCTVTKTADTDAAKRRACTCDGFFSFFFSPRGCNVQEAVAERSSRRHLRLGHGRGAVPAAQGEPAFIAWIMIDDNASYLLHLSPKYFVIVLWGGSNIISARKTSNISRNARKNVEDLQSVECKQGQLHGDHRLSKARRGESRGMPGNT